MLYRASVQGNRQLAVENYGVQTIVTLDSQSPQQRSQCSSFTTGQWRDSPELYKTEAGYIIKFFSDRHEYFLLVRDSSVSTVFAPSLRQAMKLEWHRTASRREPVMELIGMSNTSANFSHTLMQKRNIPVDLKSPPRNSFCTQCGEKAGARDRFCVSCGNRLN